MDKGYVFCPKCREIKTRFLSKLDYCQTCYRKLLDEYSYYDYKEDKKRLTGNAKKICELLIEEGYNRQEIHKMLDLNKVYVNQIINKYTIRVDVQGKKRPF